MLKASRTSGPGDAYLAACFAARCLARARGEDGASHAEQQALEQHYAEQALVWLREAVQRGYRDFQEMRQDPRLQALRGLPEFRRPVAQTTTSSGLVAP